MKRCPKCGKEYDDSWKVCINDQSKLEKIEAMEGLDDFLVSTTDQIEGKQITEYKGVVSGISITGFGAFREFFSGFTDAFGGKSGSYQKEYKSARNLAIKDLISEAKNLSANAVICIRLDFENISAKGKSLVMVSATGTAVTLKDKEQICPQNE